MSMETQFVELNGKKYKVTYEEIKESKPISEPHREKGQYYWMVDVTGTPFKFTDYFLEADDKLFEIGNYFLTKEDAECVTKRVNLFRKMLRFSLMNGLRDMKDNDNRFLLVIDNGEVHCSVEPCNSNIPKRDCVYFASDEVAGQAKELFGKEFLELYGNN